MAKKKNKQASGRSNSVLVALLTEISRLSGPGAGIVNENLRMKKVSSLHNMHAYHC